MIMLMKNIIGELIRDMVVFCSKDFIEWFTSKGMFVYKFPLPISFSIGMYKFLKSDDYYKEKANNLAN
jgi:hypothetical protein